MIFIGLIILSFSNLIVAVCPNGTISIPPALGSNYNCVKISAEYDSFAFGYAEANCNILNGHLISVPNENVSTFLAGK